LGWESVTLIYDVVEDWNSCNSRYHRGEVPEVVVRLMYNPKLLEVAKDALGRLADEMI
jgi:hypothetical protein